MLELPTSSSLAARDLLVTIISSTGRNKERERETRRGVVRKKRVTAAAFVEDVDVKIMLLE